MLSATTHKFNPFSTLKSRRIRPTNTSSFPSAQRASGYSLFATSSTTTIPSAALNFSTTSSNSKGCSSSTLMAILCPNLTGTRTVVAVIYRLLSPRIFLVSLTIFISSFVYPLSKKSSI